MSFKEELQKEKNALVSVKKTFESAAFLIFSIMFVQQLFYIILRFSKYFKDIGTRNDSVALGGTTYSVFFNFGSTPNVPLFVGRILNQGADKFFYIFLTFLFFVLWYGLIFLFVWNYCRKNNGAKWTWTALITFGPTSIIFIPTYLIYAIYVFRAHVFRFIRKGVNEYKKYNENYVFEDEVEESHDEFEV